MPELYKAYLLIGWLQSNNPLEFIGKGTLIYGALLLIASFLVTRHLYKTTLPTRLAETLEKNYNAERARADSLEKQNKELLTAKAELEREHATIAIEFSQLSQLFAKKSLILEGITGEFTTLAELAEGGKLGEYLRAMRHPVEDVHKTQEPPSRKRTERS